MLHDLAVEQELRSIPISTLDYLENGRDSPTSFTPTLELQPSLNLSEHSNRISRHPALDHPLCALYLPGNAGKKPLVFFGGLGDDGDSWIEFARYLNEHEGHEVAVFALPGLRPVSFDTLAKLRPDDLYRIACDIVSMWSDSRIGLFGFSTGGFPAAKVKERMPDVVDELVLVGVPLALRNPDHVVKLQWLDRLSRLPLFRRALLERWRTDPEPEDPETLSLYREGYGGTSPLPHYPVSVLLTVYQLWQRMDASLRSIKDGRILMCHALKDKFCAFDSVVAIVDDLKRSSSRQIELLPVENCPHTIMQGQGWRTMYQGVVNFLRNEEVQIAAALGFGAGLSLAWRFIQPIVEGLY